MIKTKRSEAKPRRALFLLLSGLLATLIILGLSQLTAAEDDEPVPLMPDGSDIYKDQFPSEEEAALIEDPVEQYLAMETLSLDHLLGSDLSTSTKHVDRDEVPEGSEVSFTIVISNSGDADVAATMVDELPDGLSYVSHERVDIVSGVPNEPEFSVDGNKIIWEGTLFGGGYAEIAIKGQINEDVPVGAIIRNTVIISGAGESVSRSAEVKVLEKVDVLGIFMPFLVQLVPQPKDFTATRPNSNNQFTLSWTGIPNASQYIVEQANDPGFSSPIQHDAGQNTSIDFQPEVSWRNDFYFRVRTYVGSESSGWSDTVNVVGAYYDEFDDRSTGWDVRRTTNIDHVESWYEIRDGNDWLILDVGDKWDWGISSPLSKAPEPPYVIEYDGKLAQTPNEVAMGIVFGGDRIPGELCPDKSTVEGWYRHTACFNTFYNPQYYWAGEALHFIWQRVDKLVWCPECGRSPMKRIGDTENAGRMDRMDDDGWNHHRIEVRDGNIKYYAAEVGKELVLQYEYGDTRFINDPYFGVFAYAGEYTSSVARFEYFSITPLDD